MKLKLSFILWFARWCFYQPVFSFSSWFPIELLFFAWRMRHFEKFHYYYMTFGVNSLHSQFFNLIMKKQLFFVHPENCRRWYQTFSNLCFVFLDKCELRLALMHNINNNNSNNNTYDKNFLSVPEIRVFFHLFCLF